MGIEYIQKGDYDNAISRLQSSVDLDENVFETRYNLGVAYTKKDDYKSAIEQFEAAINLKPNSYEANYSYAVALESLGFEFEEKMFDNASDDKTKVKALSDDDIKTSLEYVQKAIEVYEKCITLSANSEETEKLKNHIKDLDKQLNDAKEEYLENKNEEQ